MKMGFILFLELQTGIRLSCFIFQRRIFVKRISVNLDRNVKQRIWQGVISWSMRPFSLYRWIWQAMTGPMKNMETNISALRRDIYWHMQAWMTVSMRLDVKSLFTRRTGQWLTFAWKQKCCSPYEEQNHKWRWGHTVPGISFLFLLYRNWKRRQKQFRCQNESTHSL